MFSLGRKHFTGTIWSIDTKLWVCFKMHFYRIIRIVSMLQQMVLKENQCHSASVLRFLSDVSILKVKFIQQFQESFHSCIYQILTTVIQKI